MANGKAKLPLFATAGTAFYLYNVYSKQKGTTGAGQMNIIRNELLGIDYAGHWTLTNFASKIAPIVIGVGASIAASKAGFNRYMAKVPYLKF